MMFEPQDVSYVENIGGGNRVQYVIRSKAVATAVKALGQEGMEELAEMIAADAKQLAPVDPTAAGERRRAKQKAFKGSPMGRAHVGETIIHGPTKIGSAFVMVGFPGSFVELGHDIRRVRRGALLGHAQPRPFLRPAFDANLNKIDSIMARRGL